MICGCSGDPAGCRWDRRPEAQAVEQLSKHLQAGEALLAATRGKVRGQIGSSIAQVALSMAAPWANVGLTGDRVLVQFVKPSTGQPISDTVFSVSLPDIHHIRITDADPLRPGQTHRLAFTTGANNVMTLRATGRQGEAAAKLVKVWQAVSGWQEEADLTAHCCMSCGKPVEASVKFCPYCGAQKGGA
jgi:hypothetical protein